MDVREFNSRFAVPSAVGFEAGDGGLPRITITGPEADAQIYLHGGHVTRFQPHGRSAVLFLSRQSFFRSDKAIRGGIPVIFPWFGPRSGDPAAPQHGFARTMMWEVRDVTQDSAGTIAITMALDPSDATRRWVANDFLVTYTIAVGRALDLELEIRNSSVMPFTFEEALHTYLHVGDVRATRIEGLAGRTFVDKVDGQRRKIQPPGLMQLDGETDRVYLDTPDAVTVHDPVLQRRLILSKSGSRSTVIWNPWFEKARGMSDLGEDEWANMVCVETANAADDAVTLAPGQSHTMRASIAVNEH